MGDVGVALAEESFKFSLLGFLFSKKFEEKLSLFITKPCFALLNT